VPCLMSHKLLSSAGAGIHPAPKQDFFKTPEASNYDSEAKLRDFPGLLEQNHAVRHIVRSGLDAIEVDPTCYLFPSFIVTIPNHPS
jgi:hypothetical protein